MASEHAFAELFRGLREKSGLSQGVLAKRANLSVSAIRHYEYGLREPTYSAMVQLAGALGVSLGAFSPSSGAGHLSEPPAGRQVRPASKHLAKVVAAWPTLPQNLRSAILAIVDASTPHEQKAPGVPQDEPAASTQVPVQSTPQTAPEVAPATGKGKRKKG